MLMHSVAPLVLVGGGGHASDVLGVIEACNAQHVSFDVMGYVDDDPTVNDRLRLRGVERLGSVDEATSLEAYFLPAIGYPKIRAAVVARLLRFLEPAPSPIHPATQVATGVTVKPGAVVFDGVGVGPYASVGNFTLIGRGAIVGHDAAIGDYASLMPGCVISGGVTIGAGALVGANSTVLEGCRVGDWATLGAGAVLRQDLPAGCTAVGVPARVTRRPSEHDHARTDRTYPN